MRLSNAAVRCSEARAELRVCARCAPRAGAPAGAPARRTAGAGSPRCKSRPRQRTCPPCRGTRPAATEIDLEHEFLRFASPRHASAGGRRTELYTACANHMVRASVRRRLGSAWRCGGRGRSGLTPGRQADALRTGAAALRLEPGAAADGRRRANSAGRARAAGHLQRAEVEHGGADAGVEARQDVRRRPRPHGAVQPQPHRGHVDDAQAAHARQVGRGRQPRRRRHDPARPTCRRLCAAAP
jgi:hypothetical protein